MVLLYIHIALTVLIWSFETRSHVLPIFREITLMPSRTNKVSFKLTFVLIHLFIHLSSSA